MNKHTFLAALQNTDTLKQVQLPDLEKLMEEFPYFQTARLLYAKKAALDKAPTTDKAIATAATYAAKRTTVYRLLHDKLPEKYWKNTEYDPLNDVERFKQAVLEAEQNEPLNEQLLEKEAEKTKASFNDNLSNPTDGDLPNAKPSQLPDEAIDAPPLNVPVFDKDPTKTDEIAEEARREVDELMARLQAQQTEIEEADANKKEVPAEDTLPGKEEMQQLIDEDLRQLRTEVEAEVFDYDTDFEEEEETEEEPDPASDSDLIVELKKKVDDYMENREGRNSWRPDADSKNEDAFDHTENDGIVLSENEESTIRDFVSKQKSAPEQTPPTDPDILLSETMAKAYARQGHYKNAIGIYEQLSLKNPDKMAYFAAKIEELKKKL